MKPTLTYRVTRRLYLMALLPLLRFRAWGREHIPPRGGVILACNHQSFLDPLLLGSGNPRLPTHFMARETLFRGALGWYLRQTHCFPVRRGGADRGAWKAFEDLVKAGEQVAFFPEGTRSPDGSLQPAVPGSGLLVHRCGPCAVIPARVRGTAKVLGRGRGFGGLHPVSVTYGPPVDLAAEWAQEGSREVYAAMADKIMAAIAALPPPPGRADDN